MFNFEFGFVLFVVVGIGFAILPNQPDQNSWLLKLAHGYDVLSGSWLRTYGRWLRRPWAHWLYVFLVQRGEKTVTRVYYMLRILWMVFIVLLFCYAIPTAHNYINTSVIIAQSAGPTHVATENILPTTQSTLKATKTQTPINTDTVMGIPITNTFLVPTW